MRFVPLALACAIAAAQPAQAQTRRYAPSATGDAVGAADAVICRRFLRTGTLADYYRVCKTRAEWDRERRNIRQGLSVSDSCRERYSGNSTLCPL